MARTDCKNSPAQLYENKLQCENINEDNGQRCRSNNVKFQCPICCAVYCRTCADYNDYRCDNHDKPILLPIKELK